MAYCTVNDLLKFVDEKTLIELSDLENSGSIDASVVDEAIETADAQIDGYIANRVTAVPLNPVPVLISKVSCKMALHDLYSNRMSFMPETVSGWYKECLRVLEAIRNGKMQLLVPAAAAGNSEYRINKTSGDQIFPKKELDKF